MLSIDLISLIEMNPSKNIPDRITLSVILYEPDEAVTLLVDSAREVHPAEWRLEQGFFCLGNAFFLEPPPGSAHKRKLMILKDEELLFFSANLFDGWNSLAFRITRRTACRAFVFSLCNDDLIAPARSFFLIDNGKVLRSVSVLKEDKWVFFDQGDVIKGEEEERYNERLIRKRLTNEKILRIAAANGIDLIRLLTRSYEGAFLEER